MMKNTEKNTKATNNKPDHQTSSMAEFDDIFVRMKNGQNTINHNLDKRQKRKKLTSKINIAIYWVQVEHGKLKF